MAAFPQPNLHSIHIHNAPVMHRQYQHLHPGPYLRTNQVPHNPFPVNYSPSYFPVPAGWDPSVSLAHPYIYDPNQVKHRRRTTPEQLKILEDTFKTDPKPNAALRKQLSLEIGMTPRVLQVWFQNRRMKVKRMVKKGESAARHRASAEPERNSEGTSSADPSTSPPAPPTPATTDNHDSPASPAASTPSRSDTPSTDGGARLAPPETQDGIRRGSLPALSTTTFSLSSDPPSPAPLRHASSAFEGVPDPAVFRRRSMTSLQRLEGHPFASLVAATNGLSPPHTIVPPTPPAFSPARSIFPHHHHSPSTPEHPARLPQTNRAASFHVVPAPHNLHAFHPHTAAAQPYAFPPRPIHPPRPGPLPAADYSFGTPPTQNAAQEEVDVRPYVPQDAGDFSVRAAAAAAAGVSVPRLLQLGDDDTDTEYSSSRFGSIASDTSASASASASVSGASGWGDDRRGSWTGQVADMLSGLDMRGGESKVDESMWADDSMWAPGSSEESLVYPEDGGYADSENRAYNAQEGSAYDPESGAYVNAEKHVYDTHENRAYGTQERQYDTQENRSYADAPGMHVPISKASSLAFALCGGGGEEMLEMHHALAGYAEHPSITEGPSLHTFTTAGTDGAPYNMY